MEIEKLSEWNPWWENPELIKTLMGEHRPSYDSLTNSINIKEITVLVGVRRSGKSTLMYQMICNLFVINDFLVVLKIYSLNNSMNIKAFWQQIQCLFYTFALTN